MTEHQSNSSFKAILFDLDGTLVDSAPDLCAAANYILAPLGRREVDVKEIELMIGDGVPKLVERSFKATGDIPPADELAAHTKDFIEYYEPRSADLTKPFPGAIDTLKQLQGAGYRMAVCSNKPEGATREILAKLELDVYFPVVIGGDTLPGIKKPDPRHLAAALEAMGVDKADAVMVGDNANDVAASHGLGIPVVLLSHGYTRTPTAELGAERVIDRFDELAQALGEMAATRG